MVNGKNNINKKTDNTFVFTSGVHHKKADCDSNLMVEKVKKIVENVKMYFYPKRY